MSLGGHIVTRSPFSRSLYGDLLAAPRHPLLFLYPPWFSSKSGTSVADEKRVLGLSTQRKAPIRSRGDAGSSFETAAQRQEAWPVTVREDKRLRKLPIAQGSLRLAALRSPKGTPCSFGQRTQLVSHGFSVHLQKRHYSPTTSAATDTVALSQTFAAIHAANINQETSSINSSPTANETGKPPVRIVRAAKRRQRHLADKASVNLQLKDKSILSFDWRVPLDLLEQHTQSDQSYINGEGERILVHRDVIPLFAGNLRETLWEIKVRSGCQVHVLGEAEAIGVYRPVLLHGSQSSIEMAKEVMSELFRQVLPDVRGFNGNMLLFGAAAEDIKESKPFLVRSVWATEQKLRQRRVDKIRRPEVWTTLSFADYVADLVHSTVSRSMQRHLYKNEKPHVMMVREKLEDLFKDPRYDDIISVQAFNDTLTFLYKHSMISTMRTLFVRMESLRLRMLPETFNIMLRSAAVRKDLHHYTSLLRLMIQKGYEPNEGSWLALVMAVPSRAVQLRVESSMREKGLLRSPAAIEWLTTLILSGELIGHLSSGQDVPSFIRRINGIYGPEWMSPSSLNRVLDVLGERGSFSQASDTIKLFLERDVRPNTVSLNTLLSHCQRQSDLTQAIRLMQDFTLDCKVEADGITYHNLFMLAWNSQQYNVCRVVWRHACIEAAVSYKMQELMLRSLMRNTPSEPKTRGKAWIVSAAKVIAGVALEPGTIAKLIGWSQTGQQREKNLALAKEVLAQDLAAVLKHRPGQSLTQQLTEALALDRDWTDKKLWKETSTAWKVENAVNIPLIPRSTCLVRRVQSQLDLHCLEAAPTQRVP